MAACPGPLKVPRGRTRSATPEAKPLPGYLAGSAKALPVTGGEALGACPETGCEPGTRESPLWTELAQKLPAQVSPTGQHSRGQQMGRSAGQQNRSPPKSAALQQVVFGRQQPPPRLPEQQIG